MERKLGVWFSYSVISVYVVVASWLTAQVAPKWQGFSQGLPLGGLDFADLLPAGLLVLFTVFFVTPLWRLVWCVPIFGSWLAERIFPDLNGEWEVTIHSNWPVIGRMLEASRSAAGARFDPDKQPTELLAGTSYRAKIEQGWRSVDLVVTNPDGKEALQESRTISFDLLAPEAGKPHRIAYVFHQENRAQGRAATDVDDFEGAAVLSVSADARTLSGPYFTNRNWAKGLNTAGRIEMKKVR